MSGYRRYFVIFMALSFAAHLISLSGCDARATAQAISDEGMAQLAFNPSHTIELPPPGTTIRNQRWALVQIPLQVVNLPVGFKLTALSVKPEIEFADGSTWNSDWQSLLAFGQQLGLGTPLPKEDAVAAFLMERTLFDAKAAIPATVHLTLALVLAQETGQSTLQPGDEFLLPGEGLCRFRQPGFDNLGRPAWCLIPEPVPLGMRLNGSVENCGAQWPEWYRQHGMGTTCTLTLDYLAASAKVSLNPLRVSYQLVKECPGLGGSDPQQWICTAQRITAHDSDEIDIPSIHLADYQF